MIRFVLASASPARLATLRHAGVEPEVVVSGVDEDDVDAPTVADLVVRLATLKAAAVAVLRPHALVLGCDSLLDFDGLPLGKPGTVDVARERWRAMRGRSGTLHTGHHLIDSSTGATATRGTAAVVRFADVTDAEIDAYCATGEPSSVAGAFTIDGLGGWFVEGIDGDPHTVVGVSLPALRAMLHELGRSLATVGYPTLPD